MNKYLLLIVMAVTSICGVTAQNANRSGFFMEAGVGGVVGDNVRTEIIITDNVVREKYLSGMAGDFGLGFRLRIHRHWAYELKAEGMIPFKDPMHALVGRFLPVGFRYTSVELWRNYSLYGHFNIGGAISVNGGKFNYTKFKYKDYEYLYPNCEIKTKHNSFFGVAYSVGIGINLTTHFYVEACYNGQSLFNCIGKKGKGTLNGGITGVIIGYRF